MDTLVIVCAYNEWPHLGEVLSSLHARHPSILVVDDGSENRVYFSELDRMGIPYLPMPFNLGHWSAVQAGFRYALEKGFETAVTFDGDGQHLPEEIPYLLDLLERFDIVVGCDTSRAGLAKRLCWSLMRRFSGLETIDLTSGFRAYNRRAMELLITEPYLNLEYQDLGVLFTAKSMGLRIGEVPVRMAERSDQTSRVFPGFFSVVRYLLITFIFIMARRP
jgi:glycosyltransferase involved in cell wall biosynthesis